MEGRGVRGSLSESKKLFSLNKFLMVLSVFLIAVSAGAASTDTMTEPEWDSQDEVYLVSNLTELNWIRNAPKEDYRLVEDINATSTKNWNDGNGWKPIGERNYEFYGTLDGNGYEINNLTINRSSSSTIGLIGYSGDNALIEDIQVTDFNITSYRTVGSLVGINRGEIKRVSVNNSLVEAKGSYGDGENVGGLVGINYGYIYDVDFDGKVLGGGELGGITGVNEGNIDDAYAKINYSSQSKMQIGGITGINDDGDIENSETEINFSGDISFIGGIAGQNDGGNIISSTSSGRISVTGDSVGGIVGESEDGRISRTKSEVDLKGITEVGGIVGDNAGSVMVSGYEGKITGDEYVGGITGINTGGYYDKFIRNSYSKGSINGNKSVGGLVGYNDNEWKISKSYSAANVTGQSYTGGLVGWNVGTIESSFWNTQTSTLSESDGGMPLNTSEMRSYWSFADSYYFGPDAANYLGLKNDSERNLILGGETHTFELVGGNKTENKAIIKFDGKNKTLTEGETFSVSEFDAELNDVGFYSDYSEYTDECGESDGGSGGSLIGIGDDDGVPEEATLLFNLENNWCIHQAENFEDINQSYTWNIVEGESYPFLSWEKLEPGNLSAKINVKDESGNLLENANVQVDFTNRYTDSNGEAVFDGLYEAEYTAIADKQGYHKNSTNFELSNDGQTELVILEKLSSDFNITNLSLSSGQVEKSETVKVNVSVENNGSEQGRRNVEFLVDGSVEDTREVNLNSGESEVLKFSFSRSVEDDYSVSAEIYEDTESKSVSVGPIEYNLTIQPAEGGSTDPEPGNYTYLEGESLTVKASSRLGWSFDTWTGDVTKDSREITLTMDEGKEIKPVFSGDRELKVHNLSVPETEDGSIEFDIEIVNNQEEEVTDNLSISYEDRKISKLRREIAVGSGDNYTTPVNGSSFSFDLSDGDAAEDAELKVEYGGASDSKEFRIGAIERQFNEGFNYFSLPIETDQSYSIDSLLDDNKINTVWTYENGEWLNYYPSAPDNSLNSFKGGKGYLVEATEDFTSYPIVQTNLSKVESDGPIGPASVKIDSGWNLIGSYWKEPVAAGSSEAFKSMPTGLITEVLYTEKDGNLGLKSLGGGDLKTGMAYWASAKSNATYTKSY
jgi:hypothetical protein